MHHTGTETKRRGAGLGLRLLSSRTPNLKVTDVCSRRHPLFARAGLSRRSHLRGGVTGVTAIIQGGVVNRVRFVARCMLKNVQKIFAVP